MEYLEFINNENFQRLDMSILFDWFMLCLNTRVIEEDGHCLVYDDDYIETCKVIVDWCAHFHDYVSFEQYGSFIGTTKVNYQKGLAILGGNRSGKTTLLRVAYDFKRLFYSISEYVETEENLLREYNKDSPIENCADTEYFADSFIDNLYGNATYDSYSCYSNFTKVKSVNVTGKLIQQYTYKKLGNIAITNSNTRDNFIKYYGDYVFKLVNGDFNLVTLADSNKRKANASKGNGYKFTYADMHCGNISCKRDGLIYVTSSSCYACDVCKTCKNKVYDEDTHRCEHYKFGEKCMFCRFHKVCVKLNNGQNFILDLHYTILNYYIYIKFRVHKFRERKFHELIKSGDGELFCKEANFMLTNVVDGVDIQMAWDYFDEADKCGYSAGKLGKARILRHYKKSFEDIDWKQIRDLCVDIKDEFNEAKMYLYESLNSNDEEAKNLLNELIHDNYPPILDYLDLELEWNLIDTKDFFNAIGNQKISSEQIYYYLSILDYPHYNFFSEIKNCNGNYYLKNRWKYSNIPYYYFSEDEKQSLIESYIRQAKLGTRSAALVLLFLHNELGENACIHEAIQWGIETTEVAYAKISKLFEEYKSQEEKNDDNEGNEI